MIADRSPAASLGMTAALAVLVMTSTGGTRTIRLESDVAWKTFGFAFAADDATIAMVDVTPGCVDGTYRGCMPVIRIGRSDGTRVVETRRITIADAELLPQIDVRGDTVLVRAHDDRFAVYAGSWPRHVTIDPRCTNSMSAFTGAYLSTRAILIAGREAWCVYELRGAHWQLGAAVATAPGTVVRITGARVVVLTGTGLAVHERTPAGWQRTRGIAHPEGWRFSWDLAVDGRWVVVHGRADDAPDDDDGALFVYDLDRGLALAATLPSQITGDDEFAARFDVGDTILAAAGRFDQYWRFTGGAWRPAGLLEHPTERSIPSLRTVRVGSAIWIGEPDPFRERAEPGVIYGHAIARRAAVIRAGSSSDSR